MGAMPRVHEAHARDSRAVLARERVAMCNVRVGELHLPAVPHAARVPSCEVFANGYVSDEFARELLHGEFLRPRIVLGRRRRA